VGLYKKGRMWYMAVTANGRQFNRSTHTANKQLAKRILAKIEGEIAEGRFNLPRSNPPTLESWLRELVDAVPNPNTRRRYSTSLDNLISFFKTAKISQVSVERVEAFKTARRSSGVKAATINRDLFLLRSALKRAARQRLIGQNPFDSIDLLEERKERRVAKVLSFEQEISLLAAVNSPLLRALIVLLVNTGLRIDREALPLKWTDLDLDEGLVAVRETKTLAGRRTIPLTEFCKQELMRWRQLTGPEYSKFVFPASSDSSIHLKGVRRSWTAALKKAKIDYFPIYNLRATFASRLSAAGVPDVFVSQMMGHAGGLLQTYSKAILDFRRDAIRKMEESRRNAISMIPEIPSSKTLQ